MPVVDRMVLPVRAADDVVRVRQATRERAVTCGFSLVDQTKIVTAASDFNNESRTFQLPDGWEDGLLQIEAR